MTQTDIEIDVTKMSKAAAIKAVMKILNCTEQQAQEFVALVRGETRGDLIHEEKSGTRGTKEKGGTAEGDELLEDGDGYGESPDDDEARRDEDADGG